MKKLLYLTSDLHGYETSQFVSNAPKANFDICVQDIHQLNTEVSKRNIQSLLKTWGE